MKDKGLRFDQLNLTMIGEYKCSVKGMKKKCKY